MPGPKEMDPAFKKFLEDTNRASESARRRAEETAESVRTARIAEAAVTHATGTRPVLPPAPSGNAQDVEKPPAGNSGGGSGVTNPPSHPSEDGSSWKKTRTILLTLCAIITTGLTVYFMVWRTSSDGINLRKTEIHREELELQLKLKQAELELEKTRRGPATVLVPETFSGGRQNQSTEKARVDQGGSIETVTMGNAESILSRIESSNNRFVIGKVGHSGVCASDQEFFYKVHATDARATLMEISSDCSVWLRRYPTTGPYRVFTEKGRRVNLIFQ